ncbi:uncharacterized protein Gasu_12240 [Galdieria sulphuraria]|uniref:Uncharacterized protein n=1 Tax=Galdieria sulphuraria TaxID=130081 RepID=M2XMX9_GALSU|nr:uncharacterized protein Gasu_12240 [Galdieria sulphuraria]EME31552.1 hypothetical protein Gasu_12240 [Galdieria sulphuraria]|eukprot:XP_005708072.1 hypothetical protein Gasu_12240 [Galdieria sulphuraria]
MQLPQIIPVTRGGAKIGWEYLFDALESAYFVAVDTEFSGLGDVKLLYGNCISEKYDGLKQLVSNRAIFSVGFSIFSVADTCLGKKSGKLLKGQTADVEENLKAPLEFYVRTFDFLLLPSDDFVISPSSATFLVRHGFDFTRLFLDGIYYTRPSSNKDYQLLKIYKTAILERNENTKRSSGEKKKSKKRRKKENSELFLSLSKAEEREPTRKSSLLSILPLGLLAHLGQADIPIILHNGLLDLAFLYSSFEENLPKTSEEFVRNLHQLLPCIYDTKLLSSDGENETSLDTVYQLCVSWNQKRKSENETFIQCWNPENNPDHRETAPNPHFEGKTPEIDSFSAKSDGKSSSTCNEQTCTKSDRRHCSSALNDKSEGHLGWSAGNNTFAHSDHSAGYDAFCTGYVFATYLHSKGLSYVTRKRNSISLSRTTSLSLE